MKKISAALAMIVVLGGAIWFAMNWRADSVPGDAAADQAIPHDFEAQGVVLRQLDEDGVLLYELEAERIVRVRDAGDIIASRLTLRHDPPGTTPGSPQRWVLIAAQGTLPSDGGIVTLSGQVQAQGRPSGSNSLMRVVTEQLDFDLQNDLVLAKGEVSGTWGRHRFSGQSLRMDIATGILTLGKLESGIYGTPSP